MWHTRSTISKADSRSLCVSPLFDVIQNNMRFSSLSSNSILISWGAQLLDIFLENTRNSKSILPFESDYIKEDMPNYILQLAEQLAKQNKLSLLQTVNTIYLFYMPLQYFTQFINGILIIIFCLQ